MQRWEEPERRREAVRRSERKRMRRKKRQVRKKVEQSRFTVFSQWIVSPDGRKVGSLKAGGAEPAGQMKDEKLHTVVARSKFPSQNTNVGALLEVEMSKKCTPLWREAHVQVKRDKAHQRRTTFGSWDVEKVYAVVARSTCPVKSVKNWRVRTNCPRSDVEKVHAVVARSTCPNQNVQNTPFPDHFWKLRCRKSVRCCGAKHISKSKV